ncbi:MAG: transposase [Usitatibacter sp.]
MFPNIPVHIRQRGHNRSACFARPSDYELYLGLIEEFGRVHECLIHSYVLMTNHIHLLATPLRPDSASEMMRSVNQRYVQHFNRRLKRTGSLWEGRFRSSLVDSESYLLVCHRYIEMNPLRAGMVSAPGLYPWSSYGANAEGAPSSLVTPHPLYSALGATPGDRQLRYRGLFRAPLTQLQLDSIRGAVGSDRPLGGEAFLKAMLGPHFSEFRMGRPRKAGDETQPGTLL